MPNFFPLQLLLATFAGWVNRSLTWSRRTASFASSWTDGAFGSTMTSDAVSPPKARCEQCPNQNHVDRTEMTPPSTQDERIAKMTFASVYPHYVTKVVKKGRSEQELHEVIAWLTGFTKAQIRKHIAQDSTFEAFFDKAKLNPKASSIKGVICGHRVEEIENPLTQKVRYLDKLVDELAKGKTMEKILRS